MNAATLNADPSAMYCGRTPLRHLQHEIIDAVYAPTCDLDDPGPATAVIAPDAANFRCYTILQSGQIMYLSHKNACGNEVTPDADQVRRSLYSRELRWVSSKERASSFANYDLSAIRGIFAVVEACGVPMHAVSDILFVEIIDEDAECLNDTVARNRRRRDPGHVNRGQRQSVSGLVEIIDGPDDTWKQKSDMLEALAHVAKVCIKMMHCCSSKSSHHDRKNAANTTSARLLEEVAVDAATVVNVVEQASDATELLVIRSAIEPERLNTVKPSTPNLTRHGTGERILGHKFVVYREEDGGKRGYLRLNCSEIPSGPSDWGMVVFAKSLHNATIFDYEIGETIVDLVSLEASPGNVRANVKFLVEPVGDWAPGQENAVGLLAGNTLIDFAGEADAYLEI